MKLTRTDNDLQSYSPQWKTWTHSPPWRGTHSKSNPPRYREAPLAPLLLALPQPSRSRAYKASHQILVGGNEHQRNGISINGMTTDGREWAVMNGNERESNRKCIHTCILSPQREDLLQGSRSGRSGQTGGYRRFERTCLRCLRYCGPTRRRLAWKLELVSLGWQAVGMLCALKLWPVRWRGGETRRRDDRGWAALPSHVGCCFTPLFLAYSLGACNLSPFVDGRVEPWRNSKLKRCRVVRNFLNVLFTFDMQQDDRLVPLLLISQPIRANVDTEASDPAMGSCIITHRAPRMCRESPARSRNISSRSYLSKYLLICRYFGAVQGLSRRKTRFVYNIISQRLPVHLGQWLLRSKSLMNHSV